MKQKLTSMKLFKSQDDVKKIYISSGWQQHADLITHLGQFSQNILLVIAPHNGGKTTFLHHLLQMSSPNLKRMSVTAKSEDTVDDLLQKIADEFGFMGEGMEAFAEHIQSEVSTAALEHIDVALMVDDAHLLSDEKIEALLEVASFSSEPSSRLHLVLFGEPSLELRLFSSQWNDYLQDKVYTVELESWSIDDIRAFLAQDPFTARLNEQQLMQLFESSMGLPGEVAREKRTIEASEKSVGKNMEKLNLKQFGSHPVSLGILIGGLVGGGYLFFSGIADSENSATPVNLARVAEDTWNEDVIVPQRGIAYEHQQPYQGAESTKASIPEQIHVSVPAPVALESVATAAKVESVAVAKAPLSKAINEPVKKATGKPSFSQEEQYLLSLDSHHYTLQLIGGRSEKNIKNFISRHGINSYAYTYKTKLSGKDWYVVVYGEFPSKEEAKAALVSIPDSLKQENLQPWVRGVDGIHQDIRQSRSA